MKNAFRTLVLVLVGAAVLIAYSATFIVDERERALVIQFGEIKRVVDVPGLYFKTPFVQNVTYVEDRVLFFESADMRVQVVDGRRYLVDTITVYRIVDPKKYKETVQADQDRLRDRLNTRLEAALRLTYGKRTFEAALSAERGAMMREIGGQLRQQALQLGIDIVDVRIRRTDLLPDVLKSTYDRMNAERLAEAEQIRAVGNERQLRIKARADREVVVLMSEARRDAEIIRGEGDAKRNGIFAKAYTQDPEFFEFYRTMQAYATSLKGNGTTMVLSPDSEFFKYFKDAAGAPPKPQPKPNN
jgi:membrane protease subunit HflC